MYASRTIRSGLLALALGLACVGAARADNKKEQEQVRRLRQQLQQLQQDQQSAQDLAQRSVQEKATLETQFKKVQSDVGASKSAAASAARRAQALQAELDAAKAEREALQAKLAETQGRLDQSQTQLAQAREQLAAREGALAQLQSRHGAQTTQLQACAAHNRALFDLGSELLARYQNKGVGEALAAQEPFVQTRRVALENLVQDYQDKLEQHVFSAGAPAAGR